MTKSSTFPFLCFIYEHHLCSLFSWSLWDLERGWESKKGEEGYGEVRAVANCAKGQWGMPSKVGGRKWRQHMGGVAARRGWCKNMVTGSDWKKPLSETFNKMQNFRRVGFHSLPSANLETPRKAPHQLLAVAEDHTTIWEIHRLRTRQSFFMC